MLYTVENWEQVKDKRLVDEMGKFIKYVHSFDDETMEAEVFLPTGNGSVVVSEGRALKVKVKIPGAKLVDKSEVK